MLTIRQKQLQVFEEMTMFEQRILCRQLSNSFYGDSIDTDTQQNGNQFKEKITIMKLNKKQINLRKMFKNSNVEC